MALERMDDVFFVLRLGRRECVFSIDRSGLEIGSIFKEDFEDGQVALLGGHDERCDSIEIVGFDFGAKFKEDRGHLGIATEGAEVKGRELARVFCVGVGSSFNKVLSHLDPVRHCDSVKSTGPFLIPLVDGEAHIEEDIEGVGVLVQSGQAHHALAVGR